MRIHRRAARPGAEADTMAQEPHVDQAMIMVLEAWHDLHSCRSEGFAGKGLIPYTAILAWSEWKLLDRELTAALIAVIRRLDYDRAEREASKL